MSFNSRRLHDVEFSLHERKDTDEEFDCVSEGCIEKTLKLKRAKHELAREEQAGKKRKGLSTHAQRVPDSQRDLLRREPKQGSKRNDGEERKDEDEGVRLVRELESPGDGDEDELETKRGGMNERRVQSASSFPFIDFRDEESNSP